MSLGRLGTKIYRCGCTGSYGGFEHQIEWDWRLNFVVAVWIPDVQPLNQVCKIWPVEVVNLEGKCQILNLSHQDREVTDFGKN